MKKLTVTFDNGPDPECTPEVLDILAERGIKATFFVCGQGNRLHPALKASSQDARSLLERARSEGHWIGNHTWSHAVPFGENDDPEAVTSEVARTEALIGELAHPDRFFDVLSDSAWCRRIRGLRCNASRLSHAELDECEVLDDGDPEELARQYKAIRSTMPWLNVFGGCCGSDLRHVAQIAKAVGG